MEEEFWKAMWDIVIWAIMNDTNLNLFIKFKLFTLFKLWLDRFLNEMDH